MVSRSVLHKIKINGEVPKSAIGPYDSKDIFRKRFNKMANAKRIGRNLATGLQQLKRSSHCNFKKSPIDDNQYYKGL